MSAEYTIDIQLTELGFPEILQPKETPEETASCLLASSYAPLSTSSSPNLKSDAYQERQLNNEEQHGVSGSTHAQSTLNSESKQRPKETRSSLSNGYTPTPGKGTTETNEVKTGKCIKQPETGQNGVSKGQKAKDNATEDELAIDNDSEDSEVSVEEEEDEDEEEELEGLDEESSSTEDYRCSICDLQLSSNFKLQDHMNLHTGTRPYCCSECGKRFCQIFNYRAHLRTHARVKQSTLDPHRCRICLKGFQTEQGLTEHLSTSHFETEFYECDLCKRIFTDLSECQDHMLEHKRILGDYACDTCGRHFTKKKALNHHKKKLCQRSYCCTDCTSIFESKNALLKHSFSHLGLLPYTCVRCRRHFRLARFYREHKCEPEQINCVACLGIFLSKQDFLQHKKDTGCWGHQGLKGDEIRCMECGQSFTSAEELKKHGGAHQRVLICSECGKGFRSALLLMSHMGGHAGQRPCLCQSCGLGFPHQQAYDSHLKDCGRTPVSAPKKRPAAGSSYVTSWKKPKIQPSPSLPIPAKLAKKKTDSVNKRVTVLPVPVEDANSSNSQGVWKLELSKQPPQGVSLVMFVPVNTPLGTGLMAPSATPLSLPLSDVQTQPCVVLPPSLRIGQTVGLNGATSYVGATPVSGAQLHLDVPLGLSMGHKQVSDDEAPLDLSKKSNKKKSTSPASDLTRVCAVKSEPLQAFSCAGNEGAAALTKRNPGVCLADPMDLSTHTATKTDTEVVRNIKKEPLFPSAGFNMLPPEPCHLTTLKSKADIKIEEKTE